MNMTPNSNRHGGPIGLSGRARMSMAAALLALTAFGLVTLPGSLLAGRGGPKGDKVYKLDMTNCAGFTASDAAKILSVPASALTAKTNKLHATLWMCSFTPKTGTGLSFSVSIAKSEAAAVEEMKQLRNNLEIAGETAPFKDKLPKGAYSDIMGVGDEAVWTDVNGTLNVRKGNIILQVITPAGKMEQIKVAEAFLAKF
jgi:hypothetical protein